VIFTRSGREWNISGITVTNPDKGKIDSYIRDILNIEGDNFSGVVKFDEPVFNDSRVELQLGDGAIRTIKMGEQGESEQRFAVVSGSQYVYSVASWAAARIFRDASYFEK
jgi:hypothetical protein